jgi:hypothetical protein
MRSLVKIALIVGIALFVLAAIRLATRGSSQGSPFNSAEEAQPNFSITSGDTTYSGEISSDVGVAILRISSSPYLFSFGEPQRADGMFIILTVAIKNGQNTAITMNTDLFEILDSSGNVYSASEKSLDVPNSLFLARINPAVTKVGQVVFDVPAGLSIDNLRLRFRGGMTGEPAIMALKVDLLTKPTLPVPDNEPQGGIDLNSSGGNPGTPADEVASPSSAASTTAPASVPAEGPVQPDSNNNSEAANGQQEHSAPPPLRKIDLGQTEDEVISTLGPPSSVTTGGKRIFTYPRLQVIFTNGVVSDVRQF